MYLTIALAALAAVAAFVRDNLNLNRRRGRMWRVVCERGGGMRQPRQQQERQRNPVARRCPVSREGTNAICPSVHRCQPSNALCTFRDRASPD